MPVAQQRLAKDRVADLGDRVDFLADGVLHAVAALEHGVHEHVHVLVDRSRDEETPVLAVVRGQIGPTAPE